MSIEPQGGAFKVNCRGHGAILLQAMPIEKAGRPADVVGRGSCESPVTRNEGPAQGGLASSGKYLDTDPNKGLTDYKSVRQSSNGAKTLKSYNVL
jgi:hypothetical protein